MKKGIIILGIGPGLGLGVAEKFGNEGYAVGMISRNRDNLIAYQHRLSGYGVTSHFAVADLADTEQMLAALKELIKVLPQVDVLFYNAVDYRMKHIMEENIDDLTRGFKISVGNVLVAVRELLPLLRKSGGSVLLTGGGSANAPDPNMGSISLGKSGIKNLAYQLHHALAPDGVFVGTLTVSGWIKAESQTHSPKVLADMFWRLNSERREIEIVY